MKKIAIACDGEVLSQHFGHCPEFNIYQVEEEIKLLETYVNEGHGCHDLPMILEEKGVTTVISGGMGENPKRNFEARGIEVIIGASGNIEEVLKKFVDGSLVSTKGTCEEHHHRHGGQCGHHN